MAVIVTGMPSRQGKLVIVSEDGVSEWKVPTVARPYEAPATEATIAALSSPPIAKRRASRKRRPGVDLSLIVPPIA